RVTARVEIDGVVCETFRRALGQELLDGRDRRVPRTNREVPHQDERAARPEHAGELRKRALSVVGMERLGREDGVNRRVGSRKLLGTTGDDPRLGTECREDAAHLLVGLDGDYVL